jgi:predicted dehydrogenase
MKRPLRVALVGCGVIARAYALGAAAFDTFELVACSDLEPERATAFSMAHDLRCAPLDELLADPEVDAILNLTPAAAHAAIVRAGLRAGKHVYTEKPLATSVDDARLLVTEASARGLRLGCAPDTFLGSAYETGRRVIARGEIGQPLGATVTFLVGGADTWHPDGDAFFRPGAGPMLDLGPYYLTALVSLLGPFAAAAAFSSTPTEERTLAVGPRAGHRFRVEVPTHVTSVLRLESGGLVSFTVGFESHGQYESSLVIHGSEGSLELPDANAFRGDVRIRHGRGEWSSVPYTTLGTQETRGLGLHDLAASLAGRCEHRASGALALHVLETATAALAAADEGRTLEISPFAVELARAAP